MVGHLPQGASTHNLPHPGPPKDTESQVQAKASSGGKLDLVVVQRTVREDILLNGCLHRALQREVGWWAVNSTVTASCYSTLGKAAEADTNP